MNVRTIKNKVISAKILIVTLGVICIVLPTSASTNGGTGYEALKNLKIVEVELKTLMLEKDYKRLRDRVIRKLTEKGLYHQNRNKNNNNKEYPKLRLTFDLTKLGDPDKWLYTQNLEVLEYVKTERDSGKPIFAITWTSPKKLLPRIVEDIPIEQIESDLDELLEQFIWDYKHGNSLKE